MGTTDLKAGVKQRVGIEAARMVADGAVVGLGTGSTAAFVIDYLAERFVVVVDESKLVPYLGATFPVPIEVIPMAVMPVLRKLEKLGAQPAVRMAVKKDGPVISDQGNFIVDARFERIEDPAYLEATLNNIPGVVENGIFTGAADIILIGLPDGSIRRLE